MFVTRVVFDRIFRFLLLFFSISLPVTWRTVRRVGTRCRGYVVSSGDGMVSLRGRRRSLAVPESRATGESVRQQYIRARNAIIPVRRFPLPPSRRRGGEKVGNRARGKNKNPRLFFHLTWALSTRRARDTCALCTHVPYAGSAGVPTRCVRFFLHIFHFF